MYGLNSLSEYIDSTRLLTKKNLIMWNIINIASDILVLLHQYSNLEKKQYVCTL